MSTEKNIKVSVEVKMYLYVCMHILVYTKICENQEHTINERQQVLILDDYVDI